MKRSRTIAALPTEGTPYPISVNADCFYVPADQVRNIAQQTPGIDAYTVYGNEALLCSAVVERAFLLQGQPASSPSVGRKVESSCQLIKSGTLGEAEHSCPSERTAKSDFDGVEPKGSVLFHCCEIQTNN